MKYLHKLTFILLIIGGLNWLTFALFNWDISALLGGQGATAAKVVYVLVGLSAISEIVRHKGFCVDCGKRGMATPVK